MDSTCHQDVVGCYYGINITSLDVERVVRRRGGILSLARQNVIEVRLTSIVIGPVELHHIFQLRDTRYIGAKYIGTNEEQRVLRGLNALAEHYRQEAA
jgi:hypothetical protein